MAKTVNEKSGLNLNYMIIGISMTLIVLRQGFEYIFAKNIGSTEVYETEQPYFEINDFMDDDEIETLKNYVFDTRRFLTGNEAFNVGVEDIGEAVPVGLDGSCPGDLFNSGHGKCVIPGRYDIGTVRTGKIKIFKPIN